MGISGNEKVDGNFQFPAAGRFNQKGVGVREITRPV